MKKALTIALLALTLTSLWTLSAISAAPALTMAATIGFGGQYKIGEWVPVRVDLRNEGADLSAEVQVEGITGNGLRTLYTRPVTLPARSQKTLFLYSLYTGFVRDVEVRLVQGENVVARTKVQAEPVPDSTYLVGVVADEPYPSTALSAMSAPATRRAVRLARLTLDDLPPRVQALRSLEAIILSNVSTGNLSREQREALAAWVDMGGQLVVAGGPGWQRTVEGIADLLPVQASGTRVLDRMPALERLAEVGLRLGDPYVATVATLRADAQVLAGEDGLPLVAERQVGAGRVDFLALDLALEPFNGWAGTATIWRKLMVASPSSVTPEAQARRGNPTGGPPITSALANIPAMDLPSAKWLGLFLAAYILCVGPINYLVLRRLDRREWAWATVPLLTVLFSAGAYLIGFRAKGGDVVVSTVSIVRSYADGRPAVAESYFGLFSPSRRTYEVVLPGESMVSTLPDYGPWNSGGSAPSFKVQQGDNTILRDVYVDMWAMRSFMVEQPIAGNRQILKADLRVEGGRIVGTIANLGSYPLEGAVLVQGLRTVRLGTLAPGETRPVQFDAMAPWDPQFDQWMPMSIRILGQEEPMRGPGPMAPDRDRIRRQSLLDYLYGYGKGGPPEVAVNRGGLEFVAWSADDPLQLEVKGYTMSRKATVLVQAELPVTFAGQEVVVPPGFLSRTTLEANANTFQTTPVGFFLAGGSATFQFQLPPGTERMRIEELTLYFGLLNRPPGSSSSAEISVYDWGVGDWVEIKDVGARGSRALENPQRFVSETGTIQLKLGGSERNGQPLEVNQLDFATRGRR